MASVLQVATIKDQGGNNNAIEIANSSANVTINNLTSSTGFPAGHIIQATFNTLQINETAATNTTYATTPEGMIDNYQTEIQVKYSNSKIIILMPITLLSQREGPSDAYGTIGFTHSATSGDSKSASDYTNIVTGGANESVNSLYVNRRNVGSGDIGQSAGFTSTGVMVFSHTHGQSVDRYLYYTAMTRTSYSNLSASYIYNPLNLSAQVILMEIVQ